MKTTIIAPHPDDEWIGCGCTILKKLDGKQKIKVLIITRASHSERRIKISKNLAKTYKYEIKILGEPEKNINEKQLISFLKRNISKQDVVYVPDYDIHPDHRKITSIAQNALSNRMYQYCVYNNSLNPVRRTFNILVRLLTGKTPSSFRKGKHDFVESYGEEIKNKKIVLFGEAPRAGDVLRKLK